jgi:hypothetical protein
VVDVDNARETVDAEGRIIGLAWVPARPSEVETLLLSAADAYPIALASLEAGELVAGEGDRVPIEYPPGVEMTLALVRRLSVWRRRSSATCCPTCRKPLSGSAGRRG